MTKAIWTSSSGEVLFIRPRLKTNSRLSGPGSVSDTEFDPTNDSLTIGNLMPIMLWSSSGMVIDPSC